MVEPCMQEQRAPQRSGVHLDQKQPDLNERSEGANLPVRSVFQQVEHRVRRIQLQENPQSVSPVFPPETREISQWRLEGLMKHARTRTHILVFFSVLRSVCFMQSVKAMFEDGRFSLMSPLILPLQPVRQLYSFSPAGGVGGGAWGPGLCRDWPALCKH